MHECRLAKDLFGLDEIKERLDDITFKCWIEENGREVLSNLSPGKFPPYR